MLEGPTFRGLEVRGQRPTARRALSRGSLRRAEDALEQTYRDANGDGQGSRQARCGPSPMRKQRGVMEVPFEGAEGS